MVAQIRSTLASIVILCIIFGTAIAIIAYGRGYRLDITDLSLNSTGLVVVQSEPTGAAQIKVDGKLKDATPATISLKPGRYTITVSKEGFQSWEKHIKVQGEVVNKIDALLLPTNPALTALTASGVVNPSRSPDGSKLAYIVPNTSKSATASASIAKPGIWILDLVDKPLGLNRDARQIVSSATVDFSKATLSWSPDNTKVLATFAKPVAYYLFDINTLNSNPQQIFDIKTIQSDWKNIKDQHEKEQLSTLPKLFTYIATSSADILSFSPDETKVLYQASESATLPVILTPRLLGTNSTDEIRTLKAGLTYVYDVKEDKNYLVSSSLGTPQWLPSSRHLVMVGKNTVEIMDYDGVNRRTAYAGQFWDSFAVPWASGGKLVILTHLTDQTTEPNNLYTVNLR